MTHKTHDTHNTHKHNTHKHTTHGTHNTHNTQITDRRPGDAPAVWAGTDLASQMLGWRATRTLDDMCASLWHWGTKNPKGYETEQ